MTDLAVLRDLEEVADCINQAQAIGVTRGVGRLLDRAWDLLWPLIKQIQAEDALREQDTIRRAAEYDVAKFRADNRAMKKSDDDGPRAA